MQLLLTFVTLLLFTLFSFYGRNNRVSAIPNEGFRRELSIDMDIDYSILSATEIRYIAGFVLSKVHSKK